ncbi:hypothetical protein GF391_01505 [Candidatus Uhrbacteria bacterium]|nr:hypothetical protein [Candidatus Uhrbacteria bacterium]
MEEKFVQPGNKSESLERQENVERLNIFLDENLHGVLDDEVLANMPKMAKVTLFKKLYSRNWRPTFEYFSNVVKEIMHKTGGDVDSVDLRRGFIRNLLLHIPAENLIRYLKAPRRFKDLDKELQEALQDAESHLDLPLELVPDEVVASYYASKGHTSRFFAIHTSNVDLKDNQNIKMGKVSEVVPNMQDMPDTGWTWYSYGDIIFARGSDLPNYLYFVEGYPSDFEHQSSFDQEDYQFLGMHRELKQELKLNLKDDPEIVNLLGYRVMNDREDLNEKSSHFRKAS